MITLFDSSHDETPSIGALDLNLANGFVVERFDPGFPKPREVVQPYVTGSGDLDTTRFHGGSTAELRGIVIGTSSTSRQQSLDAIKQYMLPGKRTALVWDLNDDPADQRRIDFRCSAWSAPIERHNRIYWRASLFNPLGIQVSASTKEITVEHGAHVDGIRNKGNHPYLPKAKLTSGKWVNPNIGCSGVDQPTHDQHNYVLFFGGLTVEDGEEFEVDFQKRTAIHNGDSVTDKINYALSSWWTTPPNLPIRISVGGAGTPSVKLTFRDAWI